MTDASGLKRMIRAGQGAEPADLVIRDVALLDLVTGAVTTTDIAIVADRIVGTHGRYEGERIIEGAGRFAVPGFIDTHLHVESSLVTPFEFDRCVLPHGVTTAICDPHEIANVLGGPGIRYFLDAAERTVMDLRVNLSSCVPATAFETAGAALSVDDLLPFADHPKVIGLAEMMNFPGVLAADPAVLAKLAAFQGRHIDGHAPLLRGMGLNGYLAAGIRTLAIAYRLAPEHPFPAALEDARRAFAFLRGLGIPAGKIAVGGDSAGGGLTLALLQALIAEGEALPACAWLISPWTDLTLGGETLATKDAADPLIHRGYLEELAAAYLPVGFDARDPRVSPLFADLGGFPPLLVAVGSDETLLSDATRLAARAGAADVAVTLSIYPKMIHAFPLWNAHLAEGRAALAEAGAFMRRHLR